MRPFEPPAWHAEARRMKFDLGMTYAEIAEALGLSCTSRLNVVLSPTGREKHRAARRRQRANHLEARRAAERRRYRARKAQRQAHAEGAHP